MNDDSTRMRSLPVKSESNDPSNQPMLDLNQLIDFSHRFFKHPDPSQQAALHNMVTTYYILPQHFIPIAQLLPQTTDIYAVQFITQTLRHICLQFSSHLESSHAVTVISIICGYINTHAANIPSSSLVPLSVLLGDIIRSFWTTVKDIRRTVGDIAEFLWVSAPHAQAAAIMLREIIQEMSCSVRIPGISQTGSTQFSRVVVASFGSHMIPSILFATVSSIYHTLQHCHNYSQHPIYTSSGHSWRKSTIELSRTAVDYPNMTQPQCFELLMNLFQLALRCLRYDFGGNSLRSSGTSLDEEDRISFPRSPAILAVTSHNFFFLMVIFTALEYKQSKEMLQISVELITAILAFDHAMWHHEFDRWVCLKYSVVFISYLLDFLGQPSSSAISNEQLLSPASYRFTEEPQLFNNTAQLIAAIFKVHDLARISTLFNPLLPCEIHIDNTWAQQSNMIQQHIDQSLHALLIENYTRQASIQSNAGADLKAALDVQNRVRVSSSTSSTSPQQQRHSTGMDALMSEIPPINLQTGITETTTSNTTTLASSTTTTTTTATTTTTTTTKNHPPAPPELIVKFSNTIDRSLLQDFNAQLTHEFDPCSQFQHAIFKAWLGKLYHFTMVVFSLSIGARKHASQDDNTYNTNGQVYNTPQPVLISDLSPDDLFIPQEELGDILLDDVLSIFHNLFSLWNNVATAYLHMQLTNPNLSRSSSDPPQYTGPSKDQSGTSMGLLNVRSSEQTAESGTLTSTSLVLSRPKVRHRRYAMSWNPLFGPPTQSNALQVYSHSTSQVWKDGDPTNKVDLATLTMLMGAARNTGAEGGTEHSFLQGVDEHSPSIPSHIAGHDSSVAVSFLHETPGTSSSRKQRATATQITEVPGARALAQQHFEMMTLEEQKNVRASVILSVGVELLTAPHCTADIMDIVHQVFAPIARSYLYSMLACIGALHDDAPFAAIMRDNIPSLPNVSTSVQSLIDQFALFITICRAAPEQIGQDVMNIYELLKKMYFTSLERLPTIAHAVNTAINQRINERIQRDIIAPAQKSGAGDIITHADTKSNNAYTMYMEEIYTLFNDGKFDSLSHIGDIYTLQRELTTLHRVETLLGSLLFIITSFFVPKNNFFTRRGPSSASGSSTSVLSTLHSNFSRILFENFRFYCVRFGHLNPYTTPYPFQHSGTITPEILLNTPLEILLAYLTIHPGVVPPGFSGSRIHQNHSMIVPQMSLQLSTPLLIIPIAHYFSIGILQCFAAFIDSIVFRQYVSRTPSYNNPARPFSQTLLHQTFETATNVLHVIPDKRWILGNEHLWTPFVNTIPSSDQCIMPQPLHDTDFIVPRPNSDSGDKRSKISSKSAVSSAPTSITETTTATTNSSSTPPSPPIDYSFHQDSYSLLNPIVPHITTSSSSSSSKQTGHVADLPDFLNIGLFLCMHYIDLHASLHFVSASIMNLTLSLVNHFASTLSINALLTGLPSFRIFTQHFASLAIARPWSAFPVPIPASNALDFAQYVHPDQTAHPANVFSMNETPQPPPLPTGHPLTQVAPYIYALPSYNMLPAQRRALQLLNPHALMPDYDEGIYCGQLLYEILGRWTKNKGSHLTISFDVLFGGLKRALESSYNASLDLGHYCTVVNCLCTALIGSTKMLSAEHMFTWVRRFIPLFARIGMQCCTLIYIDKKSVRHIAGRSSNQQQSSSKLNTRQSIQALKLALHMQRSLQLSPTTDGSIDDDAAISATVAALSPTTPSQSDQSAQSTQHLLKALASLDLHELSDDDNDDDDDDDDTNQSDDDDDDDDDDDVAFGGRRRRVQNTAADQLNATKHIIVNHSLALSLRYILEFLGECLNFRGMSARSFSSQVASLLLTFLHTTQHSYAKYNHLGANNQHKRRPESFTNGPDTSDNPLFSPTAPHPHLHILVPYDNSSYIACLTEVITVAERLIDTALSSSMEQSGLVESFELLPDYTIPLISSIFQHITSIPIDVLMSHGDLLQPILAIASHLSYGLLPILLHSVDHSQILYVLVHIPSCIIDGFSQLNSSHSLFPLVSSASTILVSFFGFMPKHLRLVELSDHDVLYFFASHYVACGYFQHFVTSNMSTPTDLCGYTDIYQQSAQAASSIHPPTTPIPNPPLIAPNQRLLQQLFFPSEHMHSDQSALASTMTYLSTHSTTQLLPELIVEFFRLESTSMALRSPHITLPQRSFQYSSENADDFNIENSTQDLRFSSQHNNNLTNNNNNNNLNNNNNNLLHNPSQFQQHQENQHQFQLQQIASQQMNMVTSVYKQLNLEKGWVDIPLLQQLFANLPPVALPAQYGNVISGLLSVPGTNASTTGHGGKEHTTATHPEPLSSNTYVLHALSSMSKLINAALQLVPSFSLAAQQLFTQVAFDGADIMPMCYTRLIPFIIWSCPMLWHQFIELLLRNISISRCNSKNVSPDVIRRRIYEQCLVIYVWSGLTVTRERLPFSVIATFQAQIGPMCRAYAMEIEESTLNDLIEVLFVTQLPTSTDVEFRPRRTSYDVRSMLDNVTQILQYLPGVVTGYVNKPQF